jgi:hypothetical protein
LLLFGFLTETNMQSLQDYPLSTLLDLLAEYTANYTKILSTGGTQDEFAQCKKMMADLQAEIARRKQVADHLPPPIHRNKTQSDN